MTAITAGCVWAADLLATLLKTLLDRPRPFEVLSQVDPLIGATVGSSLPSGHAATSFAGAVILAFLVRRALPALFALAALVAFSRVYAGVHYPLDVVAGAALGSALAAAVALTVASRPRISGVPRGREAAPPPG